MLQEGKIIIGILFQNGAYATLWLLCLKLSNCPLGAWMKRGRGESGVVCSWMFGLCCYEHFSLAYCFNALTFCGSLLLKAENLYLSLCCFSSSQMSIIVFSDQFNLGFPTLLCSWTHFSSLLFLNVV